MIEAVYIIHVKYELLEPKIQLGKDWIDYHENKFLYKWSGCKYFRHCGSLGHMPQTVTAAIVEKQSWIIWKQTCIHVLIKLYFSDFNR